LNEIIQIIDAIRNIPTDHAMEALAISKNENKKNCHLYSMFAKGWNKLSDFGNIRNPSKRMVPCPYGMSHGKRPNFVNGLLYTFFSPDISISKIKLLYLIIFGNC